MTTSKQFEKDFAFWRRFVSTLVVIVIINFLQYYSSRNAYMIDGYTTVGIPIVFYEFGGLGGIRHFLPGYFFLDIVFSLSVAYFAAWTLRQGWRDAFHRFQNWGLEKKI